MEDILLQLLGFILRISVLGCIGRTVRQRGRTPVQIESFGYGFTFAFAMALTRLLMVR